MNCEGKTKKGRIGSTNISFDGESPSAVIVTSQQDLKDQIKRLAQAGDSVVRTDDGHTLRAEVGKQCISLHPTHRRRKSKPSDWRLRAIDLGHLPDDVSSTKKPIEAEQASPNAGPDAVEDEGQGEPAQVPDAVDSDEKAVAQEHIEALAATEGLLPPGKRRALRRPRRIVSCPPAKTEDEGNQTEGLSE